MSRVLRYAQQQRESSLHQRIDIVTVLISFLVLSLHCGGELHQDDLHELVDLRHVQNKRRDFAIHLEKKKILPLLLKTSFQLARQALLSLLSRAKLALRSSVASGEFASFIQTKIRDFYTKRMGWLEFPLVLYGYEKSLTNGVGSRESVTSFNCCCCCCCCLLSRPCHNRGLLINVVTKSKQPVALNLKK